MAVNHYFSNYSNKSEQNLVEDLIVESIKIMGVDTYYLPNDNDADRDLVYGEDPLRKFTEAFQIEIYPSNVIEYGGDREMFSKFGLEIKNSVTVLMSKRSFTQRVPQISMSRPREGDLIYVPFLNGTGEIYEITFVNQNKDFFTLGRKVPYFYELSLEKFKYSQEVISTGIDDIDQVVTNSAYTIDIEVSTGTGDYVNQEIVFQSSDNTYANAVTIATLQSWLPLSNVISVTNIFGEFTDTLPIIGYKSNASYMINTFDPLDVQVNNETYDNKVLQVQANTIIDTSETNAIGGL